jgi:hypothetical protein
MKVGSVCKIIKTITAKGTPFSSKKLRSSRCADLVGSTTNQPRLLGGPS